MMRSRIRLIRKELGMTQEVLAGHLGIGKSALSMIETGKAALSERNKNILIQDLNVNAEWLEHETGEMFNAPMGYKFMRGVENTSSLQYVPLYSTEGTIGLTSLFSDMTIKPIDYIYIPNLSKCDGAIQITGDSMYPLLKSGDIVLYKIVNDIKDVFWGDMYLVSIDIDGEEFLTVKYIHKSENEGYVRLASQNQQNNDKEVEVHKIKALAFIKASIRMNSMG